MEPKDKALGLIELFWTEVEDNNPFCGVKRRMPKILSRVGSYHEKIKENGYLF